VFLTVLPECLSIDFGSPKKPKPILWLFKYRIWLFKWTKAYT